MSDYQFKPNQEQWKEIPGYPGYEVSDHGRVRSYWKSKGYGGGQKISSMFKTLVSTSRSGYPRITLRKESRYFGYHIHRLVLELFVGPCPYGMICRHLDGNKQNNCRPNLSWGTHKENSQDAINHGCYHRGEGHYHAIFTAAHILAIRYLFSIGFNQYTLANLYHTSQSHISLITRRKSWKHLL